MATLPNGIFNPEKEDMSRKNWTYGNPTKRYFNPEKEDMSGKNQTYGNLILNHLLREVTACRWDGEWDKSLHRDLLQGFRAGGDYEGGDWCQQ